MTAATRRGFVAGALAGVAAPSLARASTGSLQAEQRTVLRGRAIAAGGGSVVVAHDRRRTVAIVRRGRARVVDVGGQPLDVAVSPDGRHAAVSTAWWDEPGVALVDLHTADVRHVAAGEAPGALAFTRDGRRLVVAGGDQEGTLHVLDPGGGRVLRGGPLGAVPRGVAPAPDGDAAWVALAARDRVVLVDLRTGRVRRAIGTPPLPERLALSPDGGRLLVTHGGRAARRVSELELASRRLRAHDAGRQPSGVAWTRDGRRLVALGGDDAVVVLGRRRRRLPAAPAPRGVAVAGRRFWTVSAVTGEIRGGRA